MYNAQEAHTVRSGHRRSVYVHVDFVTLLGNLLFCWRLSSLYWAAAFYEISGISVPSISNNLWRRTRRFTCTMTSALNIVFFETVRQSTLRHHLHLSPHK
ncbi:uncharacterized protein B0H64DRAFT_228520 [Chaetomium fimeti]|uniref:Uncharacterized protein n=1 Tax=Chaetomium fimeti TaxID=1854472 RepID=A0AAE0H9G2_9PEZI|nr:hypothetical protein B0H64DRAFT_228520 [Chaetomium fimeti]